MYNLVTILPLNLSQKLFLQGLFLLITLVSNSDLLAQRTTGGIVNPGGEAGEWISGDNKLYTLTGRVGIGISTPATRLHVQGTDSEFLRITSFGGNQYSNAVAGIELERRLDGNNILTWDIVNQDNFKIRRNSSSLFILDEEEAQFGSQAGSLTLNVIGKNLSQTNGQVADGALSLKSGNSTLSLDGNQIESSGPLYLNWFSPENIRMALNGNVAIGTIDADAGAKLGIMSNDWQLNLTNNAKSWKIGVSADNWNVGAGKLVFSKTASSNDAAMVITEQGHVGIGKTSPSKALDVDGTTRTTVLEITGGADLAEPFEVAGETAVEAGTIVAIDPANAGQLKVASAAYDKTVAGIISGAGNINPGMVMGQDGSIASGEHPVALTGRVYAKVDARYGAIQPGDLLTTSNTPGHAMKVSDATQAQGAIIGKAMTALEEGTGLVLVLVSLQ